LSTYQVLARKWRPQRFDDVIGQRGVTQTLRNAIAAGRIAQSFVFSGPRGVGKTTTARILARGLNCEKGPTADPCGECDACIEIAQGRDMDVLEIDAATNTQVDKVRDVIITGLAMAPVRNRYKIFIIDEVHRLSHQAFDALLKSIEEPPPHVVFMMATTEIEKVPPTIQSRSQVFELKAIGLAPIAEQLRTIAAAEGLDVDDEALMLLARAGDGSMRDAQSAFDQVIAFAGGRITAEDVATVLGLVRRDLLLDMADAVAREDGAAAFALAGNAVESGYDLRIVIRELARLTRDLLVISVDSARLQDPEIAAEAERDRLSGLARAFSREDLLRAFDVLTKAEYEIRSSQQPRYHLEMALLRWIHLRRLVPLSTIIEGLEGQPSAGGSRAVAAPAPRVQRQEPRQPAVAPRVATPPAGSSAMVKAIEARREARPAAQPRAAEPPPSASRTSASHEAAPGSRDSASREIAPTQTAAITDPAALKEAFLAEVRKAKKLLYNTAFAQAQRIDVETERIALFFAPQQKTMRVQVDASRPALEEIASALAGRRMTVAALETAEAAVPRGAASSQPTPAEEKQSALKERALADENVQALLDVFGTDIKEVEER
jgi:DNA polymerase-3 subunit gamma/tau